MIACRKSFTDTLLELARGDKDIIREFGMRKYL